MIPKCMEHLTKAIRMCNLRQLNKELTSFSIYKNVFPKMEHAAKFLEFYGREQKAIINCAIRFGCVGISEEKSARYAINLWKSMYNCGLHIKSYVPTYQILCNGIARDRLNRDDLMCVTQYCPKMSRWLRVKGLFLAITGACIVEFLEECAQ